MTIQEQFIDKNERIQIISDEGTPTAVPKKWRPILKDSDVLVAIPDMHMFIHDSTLDNFKFGAEALVNFLLYLVQLKADLSKKGKRLQVYQLGDLYELRFPNPKTGRRVTTQEIRRSHHFYDSILILLTQLKAHCVYGNHDYELRHHPGFQPHGQDGLVHLEHGFLADRWYHFANPLLPFWDTAMSVLHGVRKIELKLHSMRQTLLDRRSLRKSALGVVSGWEERAEYPDSRPYPGHHLEYFERLILEKKKQQNYAPKIFVSGHTHRPHLEHSFAKEKCFFIDAGAWTDGRSDFAVITNQEVAICRYRRLRSVIAERKPLLRRSFAANSFKPAWQPSYAQ